MFKKRLLYTSVCLMILTLCLCACAPTPTQNSETKKETDTEKTEKEEPKNTVVGVWEIDADKYYDKNNGESLRDAYGTGISYGHEMTFSENGDFKFYIGISSYGEGTYEQNGSKITVNITVSEYEESLGTFTYNIVEEDGITYVVMEDWEYQVYWRKK